MHNHWRNNQQFNQLLGLSLDKRFVYSASLTSSHSPLPHHRRFPPYTLRLSLPSPSHDCPTNLHTCSLICRLLFPAHIVTYILFPLQPCRCNLPWLHSLSYFRFSGFHFWKSCLFTLPSGVNSLMKSFRLYF